MRAKASLKSFNGIAVQVAHANVGSRRTRRSPGEPLVNRVVLAACAHPALHHRHMLVAVIVVVEPCPGGVGVHHTDFDHHGSPDGGVTSMREGNERNKHDSVLKGYATGCRGSRVS